MSHLPIQKDGHQMNSVYLLGEWKDFCIFHTYCVFQCTKKVRIMVFSFCVFLYL